MRRLMLVVMAGAAAAAGYWLGFRQGGSRGWQEGAVAGWEVRKLLEETQRAEQSAGDYGEIPSIQSARAR